MTPVTDEQFDELLTSFAREAIHLETRDAYGTEAELPHLTKWARGEPDDLEWLQAWCVTPRCPGDTNGHRRSHQAAGDRAVRQDVRASQGCRDLRVCSTGANHQNPRRADVPAQWTQR